MKLEILGYEGCKTGKKWPRLSLSIHENDTLILIACDSSGNHIADLIWIDSEGIKALPEANAMIATEGYNAEFAEWGDDGRIIRLKPGVFED